MKRATNILLAVVLLVGASPVLAADGVLLLGCAVDTGGGSTVVVAQSNPRLISLDGSLVPSADLLGMRCVDVLRRLLDNNRVKVSEFAVSSHLVIGHTQSDGQGSGGDDVDLDCPEKA